MARYFDPPVDYRPGVIFQLRHRLEGGALRQTVLELRNGAGDGRREAVVLVHGFNNHYGEAAAAFQGFRNQQYRRDPSLLPPSLETMLADAHWPGDAAWGKADLVDFLVYPFAVGTAKKAGPVLANFLGRLPNLEIVHFIGHSLGCRVVLEAIRALAARPRVGKVCLMAAAVPVFQVEWGGRLESAMVRAQQVLVLYSGRDIVLTGAFPPGQFAAGRGEGMFPLALGHERPPPTVAGMVDAIEISGADHGDYWGHSNTEPSWRATARAGSFMAFGQRVRAIGLRSAAPKATGPAPREYASARSMG
ncbi:MAG: alpha/beta hydrolase [Burkholderiaceae bacterium]|nr:alpha/beta hydrolase [Burkholderiaceae bacterium]